LLIGTQGGSVVSGSVGIQGKTSNVFLCKKDGQLLCACLCLTSSKQEQKLLSMGLDMRTNNVEVLKNIN